MDGMTPQETYLPYPPPTPPDPPMSRKARRTLVAVTSAWVLVLLVSGILYSLHGRPSAREQTTIARAEPIATQAVEDVVRAAGPSVVPAVSGFDSTGDCDVTAVRRGVRYQRTVSLFTPPGTEAALVDTIVAGLPDRYDAAAHHSPGGALHTLTADAGYYVAVTGSVVSPGLVTVRADTGCRTLGAPIGADPTTAPGDNPLDVTGSWYVHALPCGLRTVAVSGPAAKPLAGLPQAGVVVSTKDAYATRDGSTARLVNGAVTWTRTTGTCR
jgi:hypothetical protein